jgi:hypothetical protein
MSIKKISKGVYADINKKYAITKNFNGEWNVYKCVGRTDNVLEYHCTYKYLADAKKYVDGKMEDF